MIEDPFELAGALSDGIPIVQVKFGVGKTKRAALDAAGRKVPGPYDARCYVDTGCSRTVVDYSIVQRLELKATGNTTFKTARGVQFGETCIVSLVLNGWEFPDVKVAYFSNLMTDRYAVLLGMDLLKDFVLELDGPGGRITLRRRGIPRQPDEPAHFDAAGNKFVRLDENRRPLHYFDCGECSILTGLKRMSAAKALRRS